MAYTHALFRTKSRDMCQTHTPAVLIDDSLREYDDFSALKRINCSRIKLFVRKCICLALLYREEDATNRVR